MWNWLALLKREDPHAAPRLCERCSRPSLKRQIATYLVALTGKLAGRRVDVYRIELETFGLDALGQEATQGIVQTVIDKAREGVLLRSTCRP